MSETEDFESRLKLISKSRYLIPCKCVICNKKFKDIILGEAHVYEEHRKREHANVIDNLEWDIKKDNENWKILKEIEEKRNKILRDLYDNKTIIASTIPNTALIGKEDVNLKNIVEGVEKLDKDKQDKFLDKLWNKISKYMDNLVGENYIIGDDVLKSSSKRKISELEEDKDKILGFKKAYLILTDTSLQKKMEQTEQVAEEKSEEEEETMEEEEEEGLEE